MRSRDTTVQVTLTRREEDVLWRQFSTAQPARRRMFRQNFKQHRYGQSAPAKDIDEALNDVLAYQRRT